MGYRPTSGLPCGSNCITPAVCNVVRACGMTGKKFNAGPPRPVFPDDYDNLGPKPLFSEETRKLLKILSPLLIVCLVLVIIAAVVV